MCAIFDRDTVEEDLRTVLTYQDEQLFSETVELMGIQPYLSRHPFDLSGGEQQRAAIAKLLLLCLKALLLDEPAVV